MRPLSQASLATVRRLISRETFRYLSSRILLYDGVLQSLAGLESGQLGSGNFNSFLGAGVAADASFTSLNLENAETGHIHLVALNQALGDAVDGGVDNRYRWL